MLRCAALGYTAEKRKGKHQKIQINTSKYWWMLTNRCLHASANQANPCQHSTESCHKLSLCKTHTYFTPNLYTFHTSPISNTLPEHKKKIIENLSKTTSKILPKSTQKRPLIPPRDPPGSLEEKECLSLALWLSKMAPKKLQRDSQNH